ncbi:hemolysin family protein [Cereibacter sphaeroides]|uniref:hemolysin family protein n=1 Tax=Rhodobacterales TaxID=204455 RepID=UPI000BBE556C|nr:MULTISPECIES: hemolysin family protein [Paracoccaceae]MCE6951187.1 hemolysin family protein [Cereibacter sphaeroides]MCE6958866.1 hemolysin family protein [Cereibacter sphaeroides]MCE6968903.1 hemolysin family protein [Cereibacter sphaeroides]MCE6973504.1 hemolysin family protein [Cereibacter sphaeroides]
MLFEILIVLALIALNGVLAMSELAIVSARPARLKPMAEAGRKGAAIALKLAEDPGRFLSTVQIGITLVGVLSGAFSGATLGARLADFLSRQGLEPGLANTLGVGSVVVVLTYLSLIVGELVPKQLALRNAEGIAAGMAPSMRLLSIVAAPVVWFLDRSGKLLLALLGQSGESKSRVTDEEVRTLLTEAHQEGVIEAEERAMLSGVMRLADRTARALMTPRRDVEMLDIETEPSEMLAAICRVSRARIPVRRRATDEVLGVLYLTDAFAAVARGEPVDLKSLVREVPVVSDMANALDVVEMLRAPQNHLVLVYDEYGHFEGIISRGDILEAVAGTFRESVEDEPAVAERADGSLLVAGWMPVDEFCERLSIPRALAGDYETVAGLVLNQLRALPQLGDHVTAAGWRIEVVDMDSRRIDKVLVSRL